MHHINFDFPSTQLVEIHVHTEQDEEFFSIGYIIKNDPDYLLFQSVSEQGILDNIQYRKKESISEIETETDYLKMYEQFISYTKANHIFDCFKLETIGNQFIKFNFEEMLDFCLKENKIISLVSDLSDDLLIGKIILADTKKIVFAEIDFEEMNYFEKHTITKESIHYLELISAENILYTQYEQKQNQ